MVEPPLRNSRQYQPVAQKAVHTLVTSHSHPDRMQEQYGQDRCHL